MSEFQTIFESVRTIAVVGLSDNKTRASYRVAEFLQGRKYRIIPVNPVIKHVLGEKAYPDLETVPEAVDMTLIFRRSEEVPQIVTSSIAKGVKVIWMQEGIEDAASAEKAERAGIKVVMNRCAMKEHHRLYGGQLNGGV